MAGLWTGCSAVAANDVQDTRRGGSKTSSLRPTTSWRIIFLIYMRVVVFFERLCMRWARTFCVAFHIFFLCGPSRAEFDEFTPNRGPVSMKSVERLNQPGIGPELIGGKEARSADWPASFYSAAVGSRCSATLIGPNVLLLAAHCVGNGQKAAIDFRGSPLSGPCTHAGEYQDGHGDISADYALCKLDTAASGIPFETLNRDPSKVVPNNKLLLTGYGCTRPPPPGGGPPSGGNDGKFRIGKAKIAKLPGTDPAEPNTITTQDNVIVCQGDSGSGSYIAPFQGKRILVGVNSRTLAKKGESYLSSVTSTIALAFFTKWIEANGNEKICGINLFTGCR
jgi:Trypsin